MEMRRATPDEVAAISASVPGVERDWSAQADGEWWLVHEGPRESTAQDRARAFQAIKRNSLGWARRHGYDRATRRREGGRLVWVRFVKAGR